MLGAFTSEAYRRGIFLGVFFAIPAVILYGVMLFAEIDQLGVQMSLVGGTFFALLAAFQFIFKEDGLYLYEHGLEIVHFKRKKTILYKDIRYFTITSNWTLAGASSFFISFRKSPHIGIRMMDERMIRLFFEANQHAANELGARLTYVKSY